MNKKFFLSANTADGFVSFYTDLIDMYDLKKLYILKGGSGVGKSTFIKRFADAFKNSSIDYFYCSGDPKSLDGAIITNLGIGIIDGTAPHIIDPKYPGAIDEIVNLGEYIDASKFKIEESELKNKIDILAKEKKTHYEKAYEHLDAARKAHMKIESLYNGCVDFEKVDEKLNKILKKHL